MSNPGDFIIDNGYLAKYVGPGGDVVIPSEVTDINALAGFQGNDSITSVVIPEGVKNLSFYTFQNCRKLRRVAFPDTLTSIGSSAFKGCGSLEKLDLPNGLERIGSNAFQDCTGLSELVLPQSLTDLGDEAFSGCKGLKKVSICPDGFLYFGRNAFSGCKNLSDKNGLLILGGTLLNRYEGKGGDVVIPEGVTRIFEEAFRNKKKVTSITFPEGVTTIEANAFSGCTGLASVGFPGTLKAIGAQAFRGCKELRSVIVPGGVEIIEEGAFQNCEALERVELPDSVQTIAARAFFGCTGLRYISLPKKLQSKVTVLFDPVILTERFAKGELSFNPGTEKAFLSKVTGAGLFPRVMAAFIKKDDAGSVNWLLSHWKNPTAEVLSEFIDAAGQGEGSQTLSVLCDFKKNRFPGND